MAATVSAWPVLAFAFVFGLVIGSFLNVVIHRLPRGESIVRPRSRCPRCERPIAAWDNVPVLSYLWLRGRCRHCAEKISPRYPLIELTTGVVFAALVAARGVTPETPLWWFFASALIASAGIDWDERWIPDELSLGGLGLGLALLPVARAAAGEPYVPALSSALLGALLGGGLLWCVGFSHARLSTALGRSFEHWPGEGQEPPRPSSLDYWVWFPGLGFGDVKLMAMVGAFLGPSGVLHTILLAALVGLVPGLVVALSQRKLATPFGFGPAIAVAAIACSVLPIELPRFF
jgi:leader peptidase (prepilin peptidase)/N-methyltransferase